MGQQHFLKLRKMKKVFKKKTKAQSLAKCPLSSSCLTTHLLWALRRCLARRALFVSSPHRRRLFSLVTCLAQASGLLCNVISKASLLTHSSYKTGLGDCRTAAAWAGAEGEEKAALSCGRDIGGAGKQPTAEVSGNCWGGKLLPKSRPVQVHLKKRQARPSR